MDFYFLGYGSGDEEVPHTPSYDVMVGMRNEEVKRQKQLNY